MLWCAGGFDMTEFRYNAANGPMKVVFFFSGGASSMKAVLEENANVYKVIAALTNMPEPEAAKGRQIASGYNVDVVTVNASEFGSRKQFYEAVAKEVDNISPDVIGLSGFLGKYSIIDEPLLGAYANRIINVHPADLSIVANLNGKHPLDIGRNELSQYRRHSLRDVPVDKARKMIKDGNWKFSRLYTGDDAVAMAVLFGEDKVCSSIHSVTAECDAGPVIVQSKRLPVDTKFVDKMLGRNALGRIMSYAHELQGRMKTECDGPAFCEALRLLATGRMGIGDDFVTLDREMLSYGGYQMEVSQKQTPSNPRKPRPSA